MFIDLVGPITEAEALTAGQSLKRGVDLLAEMLRFKDALGSKSLALIRPEAKALHELVSGANGEHAYVPPTGAEPGAFMEAIELASLVRMAEQLVGEVSRDEPKWGECDRLFGELSAVVWGKKEEEETPADLAEAEFAESEFGVDFAEDVSGQGADPLTMKVAIIRPGWGNQRDKNYYGRDMLKKHAHMFVGSKMYETDHKPSEVSNRTWVSTITKHTGFRDDGAPLYEVSAHSPDFIQRVRNLAASKDEEGKSLLEKMHCSIRAMGLTRPGKAEGKEGNIVEAFTEVKSVDWVSQHGAGGHAVEVTGNVQENEPVVPPVPVFLATEQVSTLLKASSLPSVVVARLGERDYLDEESVKGAIKSERRYLAEATGSGRPVAQGPTQSTLQPLPTPELLEEVERRKKAVARRYAGRS